ncbi:MAG: hypothetical protein ACMXYG_05100 [Candidatus Woesearchaeota archaeon]
MLLSKKNKPLFELILRKYESPEDNLSPRELIHKICLSLGLVKPNNQYDIMSDIFYEIFMSKRSLSSKQIISNVEKYRSKNSLSLIGLTYPNVMRNLRKLKSLNIIESVSDKYRLTENDTLLNIFNEKIVPSYINPIIQRLTLYLDKADKIRTNNKN